MKSVKNTKIQSTFYSDFEVEKLNIKKRAVKEGKPSKYTAAIWSSRATQS